VGAPHVPQATVIICTHDRAEVLADCLRGLARLQPPPGGAEVVLVDNASTDATPDVARALGPAIPVPFRSVREDALGLSHARNRGVAEAKGGILAFLDDDAVCRPDWLVRLVDAYGRHPDAECVGGRILLDWKTPMPPWWTPSLDHHLSAIDYGDAEKPLTYPDYPYGANISFRRGVFERGLRFDPDLGRKGGRLGAGEEMKLGLEIEATGGAIWYAPAAVVLHRADASRAQAGYLFRKSFLHGRSAAQLEWHHFGTDRQARTFAELLTQGIVQWLTAGRSVERGCDWRFRAGYVLESLRQGVRPGS
jgi:glycosyltransferase involved in cell wall biosynthesis